MSIWITGTNNYEIIGITQMLNSRNIIVSALQPESRFNSGDCLIFCLSNVPLLGWWRYLRVIHWLSFRYDIKLIVLCPDEVYRTGIVCGKGIISVNGTCGYFQLLLSLSRILQYCLSEILVDHVQSNTTLFFKEMVSQALLHSPASKKDRSVARREYHRREMLVHRLGFRSLLALKVFIAGYIR